MKISSELASKLINSVPQLEKNIISFIHPIGTFLRKNSNFVIFQEGCLNSETKTVDYGDTFIVEYNEYFHELKGIFVNYEMDFNVQTEKLTNFLIDFHNWIKTGEIKL